MFQPTEFQRIGLLTSSSVFAVFIGSIFVKLCSVNYASSGSKLRNSMYFLLDQLDENRTLCILYLAQT